MLWQNRHKHRHRHQLRSLYCSRRSSYSNLRSNPYSRRKPMTTCHSKIQSER